MLDLDVWYFNAFKLRLDFNEMVVSLMPKLISCLLACCYRLTSVLILLSQVNVWIRLGYVYLLF